MTPSSLLLDTHVFLWWRADDRKLKAQARDAIAGAEFVYVSAVTAWEIAMKVALGRLELDDTVANGVAASGFLPLPIEFVHAELLAELPLVHQDPFDRMLVAQALSEGLTLVTHDRKLERYDVSLLMT